MQRATQRVISVFDDFASARRAVERLLEAGFPPADVHVARGDQADLFLGRMRTEAAAAADRQEEGDRGALPALGHFMASILGVDTPQSRARTYQQAMLRGSSLVLVDVGDAAQADLAGGIARELGAIDLDERIAQWRAAGWTDDQPDSDRSDVVNGERMLDRGRSEPTRDGAMARDAAGAGRAEVRPPGSRAGMTDRWRDKPDRGDT